ncbi:MAG: TolC family protein [Acidiferrobacterales bacterium]
MSAAAPRKTIPDLARCGWLLFSLLLAPVQAADKSTTELPNPLSLEAALALADANHPVIALAAAELAAAQANAKATRARTGIEIISEIRPQYIDPSLPGAGPNTTDSQAHLTVTKRLFDFGHSRAQRRASDKLVEGRQLALISVRQQHHIEVMRRYFDVLLADMRYQVDNETMAHAYVNFDRERERHKQGRISDVDLAASETHFQELLVHQTASQLRQHSTRALLAMALNRPDSLPEDLKAPRLKGNDRKPPELEKLLIRALNSNPGVQRMKEEVASAEQALKAAKGQGRPTLDAEFEVSAYERNIGSRDNARVSLNLRVPIYQGGRNQSAEAQASAFLQQKRAQLNKAKFDLRQSALRLVQQLETLNISRQAARIRADYRELNLDRSRALYEMEAQVSLGDAMIRMTEAQLQAVKVEFDMALAWAQISALEGTLLNQNPGTVPRETTP